MKERMVHRLAARACRLQKDPQIGARLGLTHEIVEHLGPERPVAVLSSGVGPQKGIGVGHGCVSSGRRSAARRLTHS